MILINNIWLDNNGNLITINRHSNFKTLQRCNRQLEQQFDIDLNESYGAIQLDDGPQYDIDFQNCICIDDILVLFTFMPKIYVRVDNGSIYSVNYLFSDCNIFMPDEKTIYCYNVKYSVDQFFISKTHVVFVSSNIDKMKPSSSMWKLRKFK